MKIMCAQCNEMIDMDDLPKPQIVNSPGVSVLILEHPKAAYCVACKMPVAAILRGASLHMTAMPFEKAPSSSTIIVPGCKVNPIR